MNMRGSKKDQKQPETPKMSPDKLDKRAKALRDNLRKRKAAAKDK